MSSFARKVRRQVAKNYDPTEFKKLQKAYWAVLDQNKQLQGMVFKLRQELEVRDAVIKVLERKES